MKIKKIEDLKNRLIVLTEEQTKSVQGGDGDDGSLIINHRQIIKYVD